MKKMLIPLGVVLVLSLAPPVFADWELGMSFFPASQSSVQSQTSDSLDWMIGFHFGATFWRVGYLSWDAIAMPGYKTQTITQGAYGVPSFLNLYDAGFRFGGNPFLAFFEVGLNNLWIYDQGLSPLGRMGVNLRAGAGLKFGWWGLTVSATEVYPTFASLASNISGVFSNGTSGQAFQTMANGLIWSAGVNLYFP